MKKDSSSSDSDSHVAGKELSEIPQRVVFFKHSGNIVLKERELRMRVMSQTRVKIRVTGKVSFLWEKKCEKIQQKCCGLLEFCVC